MKARWRNLSAELIASLKRAERISLLRKLSDEEADALLNSWRIWSRPEQHPPKGRWRAWLYLGGRGAGKTRSGAEWIAEGIAGGAMKRIALVGATFNDARAVMIEGESGLLSVSRRRKIPAIQPSPDMWPGGSARDGAERGGARRHPRPPVRRGMGRRVLQMAGAAARARHAAHGVAYRNAAASRRHHHAARHRGAEGVDRGAGHGRHARGNARQRIEFGAGVRGGSGGALRRYAARAAGA